MNGNQFRTTFKFLRSHRLPKFLRTKLYWFLYDTLKITEQGVCAMFIKREFLRDLEKAHQLNMVSDEGYNIAKAVIMDSEDESDCAESVNA